MTHIAHIHKQKNLLSAYGRRVSPGYLATHTSAIYANRQVYGLWEGADSRCQSRHGRAARGVSSQLRTFGIGAWRWIPSEHFMESMTMFHEETGANTVVHCSVFLDIFKKSGGNLKTLGHQISTVAHLRSLSCSCQGWKDFFSFLEGLRKNCL